MKVCRFALLALVAQALSGTCGAAAEFKNGTAFALGNVPKELVVERRAGEPVRFSLEENPSTGFTWEVESNTNECEVLVRNQQLRPGAEGSLEVARGHRLARPRTFRHLDPSGQIARRWHDVVRVGKLKWTR